MKRNALITLSAIACVSACAIGLSGCGLFGGTDDDKQQFAVYHLNGGYFGYDADEEEEYKYPLSDNEKSFFPMTAKKDTWIFDGWYFDEELTEVYSDSHFSELRATGNDVNLYAKYIDEVTVTKENFTEYFKVYSRWNGGGSIGNAGITYSITPLVTFDPANSTQSVEVEINPVLTLNNEVVWDGGKSVMALTPENDYSVSGVKAIDSSGAGVKFDMIGRTHYYELKTQSFKMKLFHSEPVNIALELNGGECESNAITVNGCEKLLKSDLPTPQMSGHRFIGWYTDAQLEKAYADWVVNRPLTLYAKFVKEITVTYHMNGAAEKEPEKYLVTENIISYGDPSREGYKYAGVYTTPDFQEGSKFYYGVKSDKDIDLYARWEPIRTITFQTNGGSEKAPIKVVNTETPYLGTNPYKSNLNFNGWYTDEECTNPYEPAPISEDLTLYALWVEQRQLSNNIEALKEFVDIQLTDEKIDGALTLTLIISIKEKYREYGLVLSGYWGVNLSNDSGSCGNGQFAATGGMTLSTINGKLTATGVYTASKNTGNNNATVFDLYISNFYGYYNIPEGGFND